MESQAALRPGKHHSTVLLAPLVGVEAASVGAGLLAAYLSLAFLGALGMRFSVANTQALYIGAACASALVGLIYWRALTGREHTLSLGVGMLLGSGCSLLAHPLMWLTALLINSFTADPTTFIGMQWQAQRSIPVIDLVGSMYFSVYSLIYVGWITSVVGAITGGALALVGRRWRQIWRQMA